MIQQLRKTAILLKILLLFLVIGSSKPSFSQNKVLNNLLEIRGKVIDSRTGEPLPNASIFLDFKKSGFISDSTGAFLLYLPNGEYVIKVSALGYKAYRTRVNLSKNVSLNIELDEVSKTLEEVIVSSQALRKDIQTPSLGVTLLNIKGIKKLPAMMGEIDIIRSIQTLPGVSSVGEGSNGVNIRGGNVDQNLIYIDDMPIFNPTHLFGLFSVFASDAIRELELYKGGIPARFGGRSASVLDIKVTEPSTEKFKLSGGIGLVSNRAMAEIPIIKEKLSVLVAGRVSFNDFLFKWLAPDNMKNTKANFYDFATKVFYRPNKNNTITLSGYLSKDYYQVDSLFSLENVIAKKTEFDYGHKNASIHWSHYFNPKVSLEVVGVTSLYKTKTYSPDSVNNIDLRNQVFYNNLKAQIDYLPSEKQKINIGISAIRYDIEPGSLNREVKSRIASVELPNEHGMEFGVFVDDEYKFNEKLTIQAGLRYAHYLALGAGTVNTYLTTEPKSLNTVLSTRTYSAGEVMKSYGGLEPRLTMKYSINEKNTLKLGYNRMQQFFQLISNNTTPLPTARWKLADEYVKPQFSDFYTIGGFHSFKDEIWELSAEAYYRHAHHILDYISGANLQLNKNIETQLISGQGKAYGLELMLTKKKGEVNGWLSYTYARSLQQMLGDFPNVQQISNGEWFPSNYDKPHNFNMLVNITPTKHHSFSFTFAYQTGRPVSSPVGLFQIDNQRYPVYVSRNNGRISDYHRLDFSWTITNPSLKEKRWEGSWTFTVYNIYARKNAYSVFFKPVAYGVKPYELSVFGAPFISLTYNFKFL
ncbi:MAG: TonB-dependent receptor [Flectobacillus sp.]|uniref:TonB-dependent receptor n=1 Tax=Flectobacillus sp. TaxID=50419 RepID=UPI003B9B6DC7